MVQFDQTTRRMVPASERLHDAVVEGRLSHSGDPQLARHVTAAVARDTGRGWRPARDGHRARRSSDAARRLALSFLAMADVRMDWSSAHVDPLAQLTVGLTPEPSAVWVDQASRILDRFKQEVGRPDFLQRTGLGRHPRTAFHINRVDTCEEQIIKDFLNELAASANHITAQAQVTIDAQTAQFEAKTEQDAERAKQMQDRFRA
jgi:hypothetical protein